MNISKSRFFILLAAAFVAGIALTLAAVVGLTAISFGPAGEKISSQKLAQIKSYIDHYYLRDYDEKEMIDNAYRGYVAGLEDPYSTYMTKEEYESYETSSMGAYSGIGVTFEKDEEGRYVIVNVNKDSPAEKAGLKSGDFMTEVDGKYYTDQDIMAARIRGKKGSKVKLTYVRDNKEKTVTIVRDKIIQESVDLRMLDDDTACIEIRQFLSSTAGDFNEAMEKAEQKGARKLILDLRNNGGGLVEDAVGIADVFLDKGVVCYVQDKKGNTEEYMAKDGKTDLETVILVNENSASSSEILAAALQDNGYTIVGTRTFGKGVIQTSFQMPEGDAVKLTILEYLSPKRHKVHEKGVTPDVKVKDKEKTKADEQLEKAEELLK